MTDSEFAAALVQKNDQILAHVNENVRLREELAARDAELGYLVDFRAMFLDLAESHPKIACYLMGKHVIGPLMKRTGEGASA